MSYDPEAIYQEDDILQAQYEEESDRYTARMRAGYCQHDARVLYRNPPVYPEQEGLQPDEWACRSGCGQVFNIDNPEEVYTGGDLLETNTTDEEHRA